MASETLGGRTIPAVGRGPGLTRGWAFTAALVLPAPPAVGPLVLRLPQCLLASLATGAGERGRRGELWGWLVF